MRWCISLDDLVQGTSENCATHGFGLLLEEAMTQVDGLQCMRELCSGTLNGYVCLTRDCYSQMLCYARSFFLSSVT